MKKIYFLFILSFLSLQQISAEGTKQILMSATGHGKVEIYQNFSNFAWYTSAGVSAPADYRLFIHVHNANENIYYGFGDMLDASDNIFTIPVYYRIKDPNGNIVVGPTAVPTSASASGYISTYNQAVVGPVAVGGASGYPALMYNPSMTGDYFIEFNYNNGFGNPDRCKFQYFDITVASSSNQAKDGRVWSRAWQFTADDNGPANAFEGELYVYTADSVVTSIDFNGMAPFVFTIACNQYGCYNTGNFTVDRRSVGGNHIIPQYRIFLNDPDSVVYPTGILGQILPPVTAVGNCDGTIAISLEVTKGGNGEVFLDINPLPGIQAEDVTLATVLQVGVTNVILWNGLNGLGQPVVNGTPLTINVKYISGLTNLPIYDIDDNPNGFIINLQRPSGPVPGVFWDDNLIGGSQNIINGCIYSLPTTGCHVVPIFPVGNNNTVNTWWNAVVDTSSQPLVFTEKRFPQPLIMLGPAGVCPGADSVLFRVLTDPNSETYQWMYTGTGVTIDGNGNDTVYVSFSGTATPGSLRVTGINSLCGMGPTPTDQVITLFPFPNVTFSPFGSICIDDPSFPLTGGSPAGGTYTLNGNPIVSFDPVAYGTGTYNIVYTYSDPNTGCTKAIPQSLTVSPLPVVTMGPIAQVCTYIPPFLLTQGNPAGGTYSGPGVTGGNTFDPALAGAGVHQIIYTYADPVSLCDNSDTTYVTVLAGQQALLAPFTPVCEDIPAFVLTNGTPAGGVYSGAGIVAGTFNPAAAGVGVHNILYIFTSAGGCVDSATETITVLPLPGAAGAIAGPVSICQGPATSNFTTSVITDVVSYVWTVVPPAAGTMTIAGPSMTLTWTPGFTGAVQIQVHGVNGCGNGLFSPPHNMTVFERPVVTWTLCMDSVTTTSARPIKLKGGIPIAGTYSGTGVNAATGVFTPSVSGPGTFTLQYNYTNTYGCAATATKVMRVQISALFNCGMGYRDIRDNVTYPTVQIGSQCWMAANLNYTRILSSDDHQRDNCIPEKYCFNNVNGNCTTRGGLYQWDEMMEYTTAVPLKGICPPSWHVPTQNEWILLFSNYVNNGFAASALKATGFSGFNANLYGAGHHNISIDWDGFATMFWTSEQHGPYKAWARGMNDPDPSVSLYPSSRHNAFSVRCVKD